MITLADAAAFICGRTTLPPDLAERLLRASALFYAFSEPAGAGPPWLPDVDARAVAAARAAHADLLPREAALDFGAHAVFLMRVARVTPEIACEFLIAETVLCETYEPDGGSPKAAELATAMQADAFLASAPSAAN